MGWQGWCYGLVEMDGVSIEEWNGFLDRVMGWKVDEEIGLID